jgi:hypothetical protein
LSDNATISDTHYLALWDVKDLPKINKWQERIRAGIDKSSEFTDLIEKSLNDHRNLKVDPIQTAVDRRYILTFKGVARFCQLITKQSSTTAHTVAVGTGTATPTSVDTALVTEIANIPIATNGFFDASGTMIRYCGTFGAEVVDGDFTESLLRDTASASATTVVFCRNTFVDTFIEHSQGNSGFSAAGVFDFQIVAD